MLGPRRRGRREPLQLLRRTARSQASSSVAPASASPRRACRRPSTISAGHWLTPKLLAHRERGARVGLGRAPVAAPHPQGRAHAEHVLHVAVELALDGRSAGRARCRRRRAGRRGGASASRSRGSRARARRDRRARRRRRARTPPRSGRGRARCRGPLNSDRADVGQRVGDDLVVAEPASEAHGARPELDRLLVRSASIASCDRALSAIASSRLSGNASSTAIARSPTAAASSPRPAHHSTRDSQRRSSPVASASPAASWIGEQRAARLDGAIEPPAQVRLDRDALQRLGGRRRARRRPPAPPPSARAPAGGRARRSRPGPRRARAGGSRRRRPRGARGGRAAPGRRPRGARARAGPARSSSRRRTGEMPSSTARRARSWRKASVSPRRCSRPASMHASIARRRRRVSRSATARSRPARPRHSSTTSRGGAPSALDAQGDRVADAGREPPRRARRAPR